MSSRLKISVIIPAYNEEKVIERCLESIKQQTRPADEIIVVNNNSTDATAEIAAKHARVVLEKKQGIGPARTRGFDEASGDVVVRIDADTVADKNLLAAYEKAFVSDDQLLAATGAPLSRMALRRDPLRLLGHIPAFFAGLDRKYFKRMTVLYGFNFAARKSAWLKCRDAIIAADSILNEDVEVSYIFHKAGKTKFVPEARTYMELDDMSPTKFARYLVADMQSTRRHSR